MADPTKKSGLILQSGFDGVPKTGDASSHLLKKIFSSKDELFVAMSTPEFYIQCLCVGVALALAWLLAALVRRHVKRHLKNHPPRRFDAEFIQKPLRLLASLLAIFNLSIIKPFADAYATDLDLTETISQLCVAYLLAKGSLLAIRSRAVAWFIAIVIMVIGALRATGFITFTAAYLNSLGFTVGSVHLSMLNIVNGIVILVVVFWIAGALSTTLEGYLRRSSRLSYSARELTVKFFRIFVYFIALIVTLSALGVDLTAFAVFGGALGVGVGLGLQKITANFVSGITLLMEKSIRIGDLIEVGGNTGWVRELNIRYALMEIADGREILIPNEELISSRVTNWTHTTNMARVEIKVAVAYNSDAIKTRDLLLDAAREHKRCLKDPAPICWLREFGDNGLIYLLTFWVPDINEGRNGPQSDVMINIIDKLKKEGISMPFPQREVRILPDPVPDSAANG